MVYIDGAGVERQIWMPKGTARTAFKYMRNQDWDALGKWPVWSEYSALHMLMSYNLKKKKDGTSVRLTGYSNR